MTKANDQKKMLLWVGVAAVAFYFYKKSTEKKNQSKAKASPIMQTTAPAPAPEAEKPRVPAEDILVPPVSNNLVDITVSGKSLLGIEDESEPVAA